MKTALLLLLSLTAALASPLEERKYSRYVEYTDDDGVHTIDLEAEPDMAILEEVTRNPANNQYILFTRRNANSGQTLVMNNAQSITSSNFNPAVPTVVIAHGWLSNRNTEPNPTIRAGNRNANSGQTLVMNNAQSITSSNFNPAVPTVVIAHGWLSNRNTEPNPTIRAAYLGKSDVNVISVDWRRLAMSDYTTAAMGVPAVGRGVGQFLTFLNQVTGAPFNSMHLIGFSLGAHLVGNAGREIGGRAARVTGLDPAGPLWTYSSNRLRASDGIYTESIHTDGGISVGALGIGRAITDVDFFPNGGNSQPGCYTNLCNHNRAWELFAATVKYNHLVGRQCTTTTQITWNTCRGNSFPMGNDDLNKRGSGMYRLDTARRYPY